MPFKGSVVSLGRVSFRKFPLTFFFFCDVPFPFFFLFFSFRSGNRCGYPTLRSRVDRLLSFPQHGNSFLSANPFDSRLIVVVAAEVQPARRKRRLCQQKLQRHLAPPLPSFHFSRPSPCFFVYFLREVRGKGFEEKGWSFLVC